MLSHQLADKTLTSVFNNLCKKLHLATSLIITWSTSLTKRSPEQLQIYLLTVHTNTAMQVDQIELRTRVRLKFGFIYWSFKLCQRIKIRDTRLACKIWASTLSFIRNNSRSKTKFGSATIAFHILIPNHIHSHTALILLPPYCIRTYTSFFTLHLVSHARSLATFFVTTGIQRSSSQSLLPA